MTTPTTRSVLQTLSKSRLVELARSHGVVLARDPTKDQQIDLLLRRDTVHLSTLVGGLGRDELKAACRAHDLDESGRSRADLAARILQAWKPGATVPPVGAAARAADRGQLKKGAIVLVRHRQYLVVDVAEPAADAPPGEMTRAELVCLDDDAQGRPLEVLWELELGARVLEPEAHGLGGVAGLDDPRDFSAYFHALKWNGVTATDGKLFQAPFRAGILLKDYQLTPLMKALELPRANLFIADDVGLGKTIEAGLVLQELLLRQRVDWVLIVCPASVTLQWKGEMEQRFGLRFEIYNREFVAKRRQERGFGVNPWTTHNRFIISYQTFRRPEYREPLLRVIGDHRKKKSLLILDEAHTAAPAAAARYAVDSGVTKAIRHLAPRFENRLFLSATPHNGHSNSFSALLEILDPQRFLRGSVITDPTRLAPVMVRRLKSDLLALGKQGFPRRCIVQVNLTHRDGAWTQQIQRDQETGAARPLGAAAAPELELSSMLAEYTALMRPKKGPGRLVFINLQKRLLSSVHAFAHTLKKHADRVLKGAAALAVSAAEPLFASPDAEGDDDERGEDAAVLDARTEERVHAASRSLATPTGRARELLDAMLALADRSRGAADAKVRALVDWIRDNQCPAAAVGGATGRSAWSAKRLIVFTEYGHTKDYLAKILDTAIEGTDQHHERVRVFDGGMSEEDRRSLQQEFNGPPDKHPVRILLATDAAREGVNLQGHCADLFHHDIPWNPARMEQRNGRIDRTLQDEEEVRCMYFFYPQRLEDDVLRTVVNKVERIKEELGSLGSVVMDRLAETLDEGIDARTLGLVEQNTQADLFRGPLASVKQELETQRPRKDALAADIDAAQRQFDRSRKIMEFKPELLKEVIDVGLRWAAAGPLALAPSPGEEPKLAAFTVPAPALGEGWTATLDSLRPPRDPKEPLWEWRKRPPLPVVFAPPRRLTTPVAHLHLQHPFVQRILARFTAQGFAAHDLDRITVVTDDESSVVRVVAVGRVALFGAGATRLHEQLVFVAAAWHKAPEEGELHPFADEDDRKAILRVQALLAKTPEMPALQERTRQRILAAAPRHFTALWRHVEDEADARGQEARQKLGARAESEAAALRQILQDQLDLARELLEGKQLAFAFEAGETSQQEQVEQDKKWIRQRVGALQKERDSEPEEIRQSYAVALERVEPVGLVYLWPETAL
jgi:hypothetical protein